MPSVRGFGRGQLLDGVVTWQLRDIQAQTGYAGQNSKTVHFGLGNATVVDTLIVSWPAGNRQIFTNVDINQQLDITEVINVGTIDAPELPQAISFDVYPNPASDTATARLRLVNASGSTEVMQLHVYNIAGQRVTQRSVAIPAGTTILPLFSESGLLAAGVYHVVLESEQGWFSKRFVYR